MFLSKVICFILIAQLSTILLAIHPEENGKDLPNSINNEDYLRRKKRPFGGQGSGAGYPSGCNFGTKRGVYKTDGQGRTFFDLSFSDVDYNQEYNINCGNIGSNGHLQDGGVNQKPGNHKPGKPGGHRPFGGHGGHGGHGGQGGHGGHGGGGIHGGNGGTSGDPGENQHGGNRPFQTFLQNNRPVEVLGDFWEGFSSLLPSPQEFGQGLGDGIASFFQTLPQIGQGFQSLFNLNEFNFPSLPSLPQGPTQGGSGVSPPVTSAPVQTTTDPDDIIYNDNDDDKPVHEDHDSITDPYSSGFSKPANPQKYHQQLLHINSHKISYINRDKRPIPGNNIFNPNNRLLQSRQFDRPYSRNVQTQYRPETEQLQGRHNSYGRSSDLAGYAHHENYRNRDRSSAGFRFPSS